MYRVNLSGTGTGVQYAALKLSPGIYYFDTISVTMSVSYTLRGSVKLKYEEGGGAYKYITLGGGWLTKGMPIQITCPREIRITGEAWLYSSVYHQEATQRHQLEVNYRRRA